MRFWPWRSSSAAATAPPLVVGESPTQTIARTIADFDRLQTILGIIERYDVGLYLLPDGRLFVLKRQGRV